MHRWSKRSLVLLMVVTLVCTTTGFSALAQDQKLEDKVTPEGMIADFVLVRPLGFVATVVGTAFFIVSLPFSGPSGSADVAFKKLVKEPACFTFTRPLGQLDY